MDLDAYALVHSYEWKRLDALASRRRLTGAEADELVDLYQRVATHLSTVRSTAADPTVISNLSGSLVRARARITGAREPSFRDLGRFFAVSLPAAFYRVRWWTLGVTVVVVAIAVGVGIWVASTPEGLAFVGTPAEREAYVNEAFAGYYEPGAGFASVVWTNNAWIAAQCVAFGITGIWPAWAMIQNAVNVGAVGGLMAAYGQLGLFFRLISPHGLLELTSIFVAGGAGLKTFWTMVSPGNRPRSQALAAEGRSLITLSIGLTLTLALSGAVEGFVTGSSLPWGVKIALGTLALALVVAYVAVLGRRAVQAGQTGDLEEAEAGYAVAYAG